MKRGEKIIEIGIFFFSFFFLFVANVRLGKARGVKEAISRDLARRELGRWLHLRPRPSRSRGGGGGGSAPFRSAPFRSAPRALPRP